MPNVNNICSPITLISYGRSGTSLLSSILEYSKDIDFLGETAPLIFNTWRGAESSYGIVRQNLCDDAHIINKNFCGIAVQKLFLGIFPSDKTFWLQKPIGIPECFWILKELGIDTKSWYWSVLKSSFPNGKFITILRNPIDAAISSHLYWNFPINDIVSQIGEMAEIINHPDSLVKYAISYKELIKKPKYSISKMCKYLNIGFKMSMLEPLKYQHAPQIHDIINMNVREKKNLDIFEEVVSTPAYSAMIESVSSVWERFKLSPDGFTSESKYRNIIS